MSRLKGTLRKMGNKYSAMGFTRRVRAGIGRFSSFGRNGGPLTGILRTTDGGDNWTQISHPILVNQNISGVAARGATLLPRLPPAGSFVALTAVLTGSRYPAAMADQPAASLISSAPRIISTVSMCPSREPAFSVVMTPERPGPISPAVILP